MKYIKINWCGVNFEIVLVECELAQYSQKGPYSNNLSHSSRLSFAVVVLLICDTAP